MSNVTIREYADIVATYGGKVVQAGAEPAITDQAVTTSASSAQSAAFNANTRLVCISTVTPVAVVFGVNPTALANSTSQRIPANTMVFYGVVPGQKCALIDVT